MVTKSICGSTLVEILVSMVFICVLMFSATTFFVAACRLDREQQEYFTILNDMVNIIEEERHNRATYNSNVITAVNGKDVIRNKGSFKGFSLDYECSFYYIDKVSDPNKGIICYYLVCKPKSCSESLGQLGVNFFTLKTACYKRWDWDKNFVGND